MKFSTETLKKLRRLTNNTVSQAACAQALTQTHGDLEQAHALLVSPRFRDCAPVISPDTPPMWAYLVTKAANGSRHISIPRCVCHAPCRLGRADTPRDWRVLRATHVSIGGFHAAMATLHFELVQQSATNAGADILDCMIFAHQVDQRTIELFNRSLD
jgi:hypothetical protein